MGYLTLFFSLILKSEFKAIILDFIFLFLFNIFLIIRKKSIKFPKISFKKSLSFSLLLLFILIFIFSYLATLEKDENQNLKSYFHGWGDTCWHLSLFRVFSVRDSFSLENPLFKGENLKYPFLADFLSSIPKKIGAPDLFSFHFFQVLTLIFSFILVYLFLRKFLNEKIALISFLIIFLGTGLAFLNYPSLFSRTILKGNIHSLEEFTRFLGFSQTKVLINKGIFWRGPLLDFFTWQRSFIYGLGLFILILFGILYYRKEKEFLRYSVLIPFFTLAHPHSLISLFIFMAVLFYFQKERETRIWFYFAILSFLMSLPFLLYLGVFQNHNSFLRFHLFWLAYHSKDNPIWFFLKNFGFVLVFYFFSLFFFKRFSKFQKEIWFSSLSLLILPNIFQFQPWDFDNGKIFFYFWFFASIFTGLFFYYFLSKFKNIFSYILIYFLIVLILLPGSTDVFLRAYHFFDRTHNYYGFSDSDPLNKDLGNFIKKNLPKSAYILAGSEPDSFIPIYAGRGLYLGYEGWLWSHGLEKEYLVKKEIVKKALESGNLEPLKKEGINYILLDKNLEKDFNVNINSEIFKKSKILYQQNFYGENRYLITF